MKAKTEEKLRELSGNKGSVFHVNIDADPLVYQVGFSSQKDTFFLLDDTGTDINKGATRARLLGKKYKQWCDEQLAEEGLSVRVESEIEDWEEVLHKVLGHFQSTINFCEAATWNLFLTGKGNWRDKVATMRKYKAGRPPKPLLYQEIRKYMVEELGAFIADGIEADDALSIASWDHLRALKKSGAKGLNKRVNQCTTILASIDKDLRQTPGLYYNPTWAGEVKPQMVTKMGMVARNARGKLDFLGLKGFYGQILSGDSVDAIPGVRGVGPAVIPDYLNPCTTEEELFHKVVEICREFMGESIEYYHWGDWVDPDAPPTKKEIMEGAKVRTHTPEEYITETGNLLYMLRKPLREGQTHPWKAPERYL